MTASPTELNAGALNRQILSLAIPALGSLLAEPLFVLADSSMVGHLGSAPLAGLSLASTVLTTLVAMFIFLAYTTTATTARLMGAGDERGAVSSGIDGVWLALLLGLATTVLGWLIAPWLVGAMGASGAVAEAAVAYVRAAIPGITGMFIVLAATGTLRGLLDTRTPFAVATGGAVLNVGLNALFIFGLGMGVAGSGLGTAVTQCLMALILMVTLVRHARRVGVNLHPHLPGLRAAATQGIPLFLRTLSLRAAVFVTVWVATGLGQTSLAAHQVVTSLWYLAAFGLDALAIAAQALVGTALGRGRDDEMRFVLRRCLVWGTGAGVLLGVVIGVASGALPWLYTSDAAVIALARPVIVVIAVLMPMAGFVFVLDGVLIGAGDGRYLALAGLITLVAYVPCAWLASGSGPLAKTALLAGSGMIPGGGLTLLWLGFAGIFMFARALTTGLRARGDAWRRL